MNVPIKAAVKDASCSMFRDPLVTKFFNVVVEGSSGQLAEEIMLNTCRRIKVNGLFLGRLKCLFLTGDPTAEVDRCQ